MAYTGTPNDIFFNGWALNDPMDYPSQTEVFTNGWWSDFQSFVILSNVAGKSEIDSTRNILYNITSSVVGKADIDSNINIYSTITGDVIGNGLVSSESFHGVAHYITGQTKGDGAITSDIALQITYVFNQYVNGNGLITSNVTSGFGYNISGDVKGKSFTNSYVNASRSKSLPCKLVTQFDSYNKEDCAIVTIRLQGFSPEKIINDISYDDVVWENTLDYHRTEELFFDGSIYPITYYPNETLFNANTKFLITNKKADGQKGKALYYSYELMFDAHGDSEDSILSIYRNEQTLIGIDEYRVEYNYDLLRDGALRYSTSAIWGNFDNTKRTHRIRVLLPINFSDDNFYTIKYNKNIFNAIVPHSELIELTELYKNGTDYGITSSGVVPTGTRLTGNTIFISKDPTTRISIKDVISFKENTGYQDYQSDKTSSWRLRLNVGTLQTQDGSYTSSSGTFYNSFNAGYSTQKIPVVNTKPDILAPNILRVKQSPLYVDPATYIYPDYEVETYDKIRPFLVDAAGKIAIDINGVTRTDIQVLSVDRTKGYILLNKDVSQTDEIELSYYADGAGYYVVDNLELNPKLKISGTLDFQIGDYKDGAGIAFLPYNPTNEITHYPYIFDLSTPIADRQAQLIYPVGSNLLFQNIILSWSSYNFLHVADLHINELTPEAIAIDDARVPGGSCIINKKFHNWYTQSKFPSMKKHESKWLTGIGYYGGEPLPHNGMIIIHIPESKLLEEKQKWINYYYTLTNDTGFSTDKGTREFNYYLDQNIKKYLSAETDYIIMPVGESGNILGYIFRLDN